MNSGLRRLLLPLTPLYRIGLALRESRLASGREPIRRLRSPVISIGNLSTGGAGKTPLAIALARALSESGTSSPIWRRRSLPNSARRQKVRGETCQLTSIRLR